MSYYHVHSQWQWKKRKRYQITIYSVIVVGSITFFLSCNSLVAFSLTNSFVVKNLSKSQKNNFRTYFSKSPPDTSTINVSCESKQRSIFDITPNPTSLFNADIFRIVSRLPYTVNSAEQSERMLHQMISMYRKSDRKAARPNAETFRLVLTGYANIGSVRWRRRKHPLGICFNQEITHDRTGYNGDDDVEDSGLVCAADRMEYVLAQLQHLSNESDIFLRNEFQINQNMIRLILQCYCQCARQYVPSSREESRRMRDSLIMSKKDDTHTKPPWLTPLAERGTYAERAQCTLDYMFSLNLKPNAKDIAQVIQAWARQQATPHKALLDNFPDGVDGKDVSVRCASSRLPELETIYKNYQDEISSSIEQDQKYEDNHDLSLRQVRFLLLWVYSGILEAWSRCAVTSSAKNAEMCLKRIIDLCEEDEKQVALYKKLKAVQSINKCSKINDAIERNSVDDFTHSSMIEQETGNFCIIENKLLQNQDALMPSAQSYTSTILAHSKSQLKGSAQRAHQLLDEMLCIYNTGSWGENKPNILAFNSVMTAWANCPLPGSAEKSESILNLLEKFHFDKVPHYQYLKPDVVSYNAVITGWSKYRGKGAAVHAESLMRQMELFSNFVGDKYMNIQPDAFTYNACINAWIRSNLGVESARNAERILQEMLQKYLSGNSNLKPNYKNFSAVINTYAKCREQSIGAKKSMDLLNQMETLHANGLKDMKPDVITYTTVIDAFSRSQLPQRSELAIKLLEKMENLYQAGEASIKPNVRTYTCVISSLMNHPQIGNDKKAQRILKKMKKMKIEPNTFTYNYVINCSASCTKGDKERKLESFKIALATFQDLCSDSNYETNSYTYAFFIKACSNLLPITELRLEMINYLFEQCCNQGKLSKAVLSRLINSVPRRDAQQILGSTKNIRSLELTDLPAEWSKKI